MTDLYNQYDDLIDLLCGNQIGFGISRKTFECKLNPKWVVKVEYETGYHQNIREHFIWEEIQYWEKMSKWFSPVHHISNNGKFLIMEKTEPIRNSDLPDKIPYFFTDQKLENYGFINGRLVCHDYGSIPMTKGWSLRLKKHSF